MGSENPIAVARKRLGLSQGALGRLLGVRFNVVSRWELGKSHPNPKREAKLREVLGLDDLQLWQVVHFRNPKRRTTAVPKMRSPVW